MSKSLPVNETEPSASHSNENSTSKSLVRNCEVAHHQIPTIESIPSTSVNNGEKDVKDILSEPKPYSCIKIADYMKLINNMGCRKVKIPPEKGKPPKNKGLKRINIPIDEQVYKGLIDLEVRDEDLAIHIGATKPKEFNKQKEVEPVLSDFYKPKFNHEYIVKPCPPVFETNKIWTFNGSTVQNAMNRWESKIK